MAWMKIELPKQTNFSPNFVGTEGREEALRLKNVMYDPTDNTLVAIGFPEMVGTGLQVNTPPSPNNPVFSVKRYSPVGFYEIIVIVTKSDVNINIKRSVDNFVSYPVTDATRVTAIPIPYGNADFALLIATDGTAIGGLSTSMAVWYTKGTSYGFVPLQIPPPSKSPLLLAKSSNLKSWMEYRYVISHYNSILDIESIPSPEVSAFLAPTTTLVTEGGEKFYPPHLYGREEPTQHATHIRIYRMNEAVGRYVHLTDIPYPSPSWKWSYTDSADVSAVSLTFPQRGSNLNINPTDAVWHLDRLYVAHKNFVYFSRVYAPHLFSLYYTGDPLDGYYVKLDEKVRRLFSWGSHVLALCDTKWYRIIEAEGQHYVMRVDFPVPTFLAEKVGNILVLANQIRLSIVLPDEQVITPPGLSLSDWKHIYDYAFRRSTVVTPVRLIASKYLDIGIPSYVGETQNGWEYLRIDLQSGLVSGMHTNNTFWGWQSA